MPFSNVRLRMVLIAVTLYVLGHFGAYTFIRPFAEENSSVTPAFISVLLVVYGVGGAAGNFIAGHTVTRNPQASFVTACTGS